MVKIVGRDESAVKRVTCRNCASILEYCLYEVKSRKVSDYGGGSEIYKFICCASCNSEVAVKGY